MPATGFSIDGLVPEAHRESLRRGLGEIFGPSAAGDLTPLSGGLSGALVFRADAGGRSAVVRVVVDPQSFNDPVRQFGMMTTAAADGVAPEVYFADPEGGVVISAFIESLPVGPALRTDHHLFGSLGAMLRRLHDGPPGPQFLDVMQCIDQSQQVIESAGQRVPVLMAKYLERFAEVRSAIVPHMTLGASHNDLNPGNLLFDGARLWIIDWESAWQNDPMQDVATIRHWFRLPAEAEARFLAGYFGGEPTPFQRAKLDLMQQVVSINYAIIFLLVALQAGEGIPHINPSFANIPTFAETTALLGQGALPLDTPLAKTEFALALVKDALIAMETPAFRSALALLSA
ncbi:MAG: phosphotransferase [Gemmatimonadales bacterium]